MRSSALRHGLSFLTSSAVLQSDVFFTISEYRVKQLRAAPWAWSQRRSLDSLHRSSICWGGRSRLLTLIIQVTRLRSRGILIFCYLTTMELIKARSQKNEIRPPKTSNPRPPDNRITEKLKRVVAAAGSVSNFNKFTLSGDALTLDL